MAILDSFFSKGFKAAKCKTLLKLTTPRIKLLRNRRAIQLKQMRREIAKLLETGQEATARIRVEHIIREEKMMAAQEIVELFCELITVRLPIIEAQRECPLDLKEAISSICFAAPRCADLSELLQAQMLFAGKYGKEFVSAAAELLPECGVNRQLVELLSVRAPAPDVKLKLLKEIAEEHDLDWDPTASKSDLLKPHEDLLNGPTQFVGGSKLPPHNDERKLTASEPAVQEHPDSDEDFDIIDFPEVPRQPLQSRKRMVTSPEMLPFPEYALYEDDDQEEPNPYRGHEKNLSHLEPEIVLPDKSAMKENAPPKISTGLAENQQFVPFIRPTPHSSSSFPAKEHHSPPSSSNDDVDLRYVLAAAQEAAETAERAAAAARSAASIAQLRITELVKRKNDEVSSSASENPFHIYKLKSNPVEKADIDSFGDYGSPFTSPSQDNMLENYMAHHPTVHATYDDTKGDFDSSPRSHVILHQPQRLPSMHEETYFSYPNLFTSQGSDLSSRTVSK